MDSLMKLELKMENSLSGLFKDSEKVWEEDVYQITDLGRIIISSSLMPISDEMNTSVNSDQLTGA